VLRHSTAETVSSGTSNMSLLSEIIKYMAEHCCEDITADSVSRHFSISRSKLNKDFSNQLSISFHDILTEMKISKACYLLKNDSISISEISDELGFKDESYFFTFFKRNTGMTPSQFRKEQRYIKDNQTH
jgi:two-component system response regulator YesN